MRFRDLASVVFVALTLASSAAAATYYVEPHGSGSLSTDQAVPGSLAFAVAHALRGSTIILENGTYDGAPSGITVAVSGVTFRAQHWHGAIIKNSTGSNLWTPETKSGAHVINDICQGIVFGPCVKPGSGGWSGGGGDGWKFLDCEFTHNDGVGFGSNSLVLHCLFTDGWFNSFDVGSSNFVMRNSIARRDNRINGDSDSIGDKEDLASNLMFDGLIAYDNNGPALWFDTANADWIVKNCTLFANHGGNNWYTVGVGSGISTTQFTGTGQDDAGVAVGAHLMAVSGTAANLHHTMIVTAVTGYHPMTITISPALPSTPVSGDIFAAQPNGLSGGYGLMSEANANGTFINNVTYNNTDAGFFDADSGDGYHVRKGGIVITGNQFNYDGIAFRSIDGGAGDPTRKLGHAVITHNKFKIGAKTAQNAFHWGGTNYLGGFPQPYFGLHFDFNTYDPDPGFKGAWAAWYLWSGGPTHQYYNAYNMSDLQHPGTFNQDHHSIKAKVTFRGPAVPSYTWPTAKDTKWSDVYCPNNTYSAKNSIHQVNDDESPYIQREIAGKSAGKVVKLTVFGHTAFQGSGPYTCDVYDYSGRFVTLTLKTGADKNALDAAVPGYAVLKASSISVKLTSNPSASPYGLTAIYPAPGAVSR